MISPVDNIRVDYLTFSLSGYTSPLETGRIEPVAPEYINTMLQGEMMKLIGNLENN